MSNTKIERHEQQLWTKRGNTQTEKQRMGKVMKSGNWGSGEGIEETKKKEQKTINRGEGRKLKKIK